MRIFFFLLFTIFLLFSCSQDKDTQIQQFNDFSFFVAGHVYGAPGIKNNPFHPPFMNYLSEKDSSVSFGFLTGDFVQKASEQSFNQVDSLLKTIDYPVHITPGNHDLTNLKEFKKHFGKTEYYFEFNNNLFYSVELLKSGWNFTSQHMEELASLIEQKKYENIFIFTHHISWYNSEKTPSLIPNSLYARDSNQIFYSSTLPNLTQFKIPIYIFGGDVGAIDNGSEINIHKYKNVHLIASGMGAGKWDNILQVFIREGKTHIEINYLNDLPNLSIDSLYNPIYYTVK